MRKTIEVPALFLEMAELLSRRSSCERLQVGCVIVRGRRVISSGCNGVLRSEPTCLGTCNTAFPCERAIHAEANAIYAAAKEGISLNGATIYCTHSPCMKCAEAIIQAGIAEVIYAQDFRDTEPIIRLEDAGITVSHYEKPLSYTEVV